MRPSASSPKADTKPPIVGHILYSRSIECPLTHLTGLMVREMRKLVSGVVWVAVDSGYLCAGSAFGLLLRRKQDIEVEDGRSPRRFSNCSLLTGHYKLDEQLHSRKSGMEHHERDRFGKRLRVVLRQREGMIQAGV